MSVREFAAHLGVSDRMVSKWEAGGRSIRPRPVNQEALDTSLAQASPEVRARFAAAVGMAAPVVDTDVRAHRVVRPRGWRLPAPAATHVFIHPEDRKLMTLVEAGPCLIGEDNRRVWVPGFYIDIYPTTNADYGRFLASTGHHPPQHWPASGCPEALLHHPVVGVSWQDARAYAAWAGKSLPTAIQWEKAARGPGGALFPWGGPGTPTRCNVQESGIGATTPVDLYDEGVSVYGAFDMCGNVWEWCSTRADDGRRVLKGGAFTAPLERSWASLSAAAPADTCRPDVGFRCVASIEAVLELLSI